MAKSRTAKIDAHQEIADRLERMQSVVLAGYTGLTVKDVTTLRNTLRAAGAEMVVAKKTVLRRALKSAKLDEAPVDAIQGEIALVFGFTDEVTPAKLLAKFAKEHDALVMKGAFVNGAFIDAAGAKALAALPTRDELRAKLVWVIGSPLTGLVNVFAGSLRNLVQVINARQEQLAKQST